MVVRRLLLGSPRLKQELGRHIPTGVALKDFCLNLVQRGLSRRHMEAAGDAINLRER
jgi:hypothetical protein